MFQEDHKTIIIYESSCKHEQLNGKYEEKKSSTINKFGSAFFALTTMQFVTSIEWVLILENIFLSKRIYEISQVWILFIVLLLWFKSKNDFFQ